MISKFLAGACAAALLLPAAASAQTVFGYNVNVAAKVRVAPTYEGSDDYRIGPTGSFSFSKVGAGRTFSAPDEGVSFTLIGNKQISAGVTGRLRGGRKDDDDLRGMDKIGMAGEAGGFVNLWVTDWLRTRAEVRKGFGGHDGVVADFSADAVMEDGPWLVSVGPRFSWADNQFTQTYFGVTPVEAARSPLIAAAYTPGGGPRSVGVAASADYQWSEHWRLTADAGYRKLLGDAADSPLVQALGSDDQFSGSLGVRYAWSTR